MTIFVTVRYGDNEELLINPNCRQVNFMEYLRNKCQYDQKAFIDLLDENGRLAYIHQAEPLENIRAYFEDRLIYIPVMLEKVMESDNFKTVKPLLEDWEKTYPQLERKIKILTGEVKRKKSPLRGIEARSRAVERKLSSNKADVLGRSSIYLGANVQSGRMSTTHAGKQSMTGRKSIIGGGKGKGKKK